MTIFSSIGRSLGGNVTSVTKAVPLSSLPTPKPPHITPSVPKPIRAIDETPTVKPEATKPSTPGNAGVAVAGIGLVGASIIPTILNSSAVSNAIMGASQVGTAAVLGDQISGVVNNLVDGVTENPVNMAIVAVVIAGSIYLLY